MVRPFLPLPAVPSRLVPARLLPAIVAALLIAGALAIDAGAIAVVGLLFVLVVPFEKLFPRHRGQRVRRPQVLTDIGFALASPLLNVVAIAAAVFVGVLSLGWVPGLLLRPLVSSLPPAIMPFVGIALFDLAIYWAHRWAHEIPLLWRFHAIHHSTEHLDWISGFRNHPFDGALVAPPFFLLLAAGFDAEFTGVLAVVQFVLGIFLHANVRWRLKPLHRLVITPEFHHWHHTNEPQAWHTNYSVFLPVWDLLFGTYFMPDDRRPSVYGVTEAVPPGMWRQLMHPFHGLRLRRPRPRLGDSFPRVNLRLKASPPGNLRLSASETDGSSRRFGDADVSSRRLGEEQRTHGQVVHRAIAPTVDS